MQSHGKWLVSVLQRFASEKEGDREVQRTMLELLNQLDGFSSTSEVKVIQGNREINLLRLNTIGDGKKRVNNLSSFR